jgi:putative NADPH-quinone reductase
MSKRVLIINGHPDNAPERLCSALAAAYAAGAQEGGHRIRRLDVAELDLPLIHSRAEFETGALPPAALEAQAAIKWAEHIVVIYPLWLGGAPAMLKGFFEQVFRYGFALKGGGKGVGGLLKGRSARLVVTMGMPAFIFHLVFGAFGVKAVERGILWMCGISPIRRTLLGMVEESPAQRSHWLERMKRLGRAAA